MANRQDHIIVLIISSLLFITGVFIGVSLSRDKMSEVEQKVAIFQDDINALELSTLINSALNNETISCNFLKFKLNETQEQLRSLGSKAVDYETDAKIKDDSYTLLKKQYNSLRAQYWLMLEKLKNQCSNNYTTILFFYKTLTPCDDCTDQGVILSHIESLNSQVYVVPIDADEDILIVRTLKEAYEVNSTPTIIINASNKITGLITEQELKKLLP
jgi:hypothetical protein